MRRVEVLRNLLAQKRCLPLLGCHDAISAKMIDSAGFEVAYLSGFSVSASKLAEPDVGLATYSEMVETGRAVCEAVKIPIIGDADTGYGGILNVRRTVQGYARAGFAGLCIEDQTFPKRCSYSKGAEAVTLAEAKERVYAALQARKELKDTEGLDIVIVARTDCLRSADPSRPRAEVFQEALERCKAFEALGADVVYAEGLESSEEMAKINETLSVPTMIAQVERPGKPLINLKEAEGLGFRLSLRGVTVLNAYLQGIQKVLRKVKEDSELEIGPSGDLMNFELLCSTVGFEEVYSREKTLVAPE